MNQGTINTGAALHNLHALLIVRGLMVMGQLGVLWYFTQQQVAALPRSGMTAVLILFAFAILLSYLRTLATRPISTRELCAQLCFDALGITGLLYFSGGPANPFTAYFLVPIALAAILLPRIHAVVVAGLCALGYAALLKFHLALPIFSLQSSPGSSGLTVNAVGMWLTFMFSAAVITYFATGIAASGRREQQTASDELEEAMRNNQMKALAALAAGSVDELGTPLATMSVLLEELEGQELDAQRKGDYQLLNQQLTRCKLMLDKLSRTARLNELGQLHRVDVPSYLHSVVSQWRIKRPEASCMVNVTGTGQSPVLAVEFSLGMAIENLLDNAADAWPKNIVVNIDWDAHWITLSINDKGPGIAAHFLQEIGKPIRREGSTGMGLGILLTHATVNRYGGTLSLENLRSGGTRASLQLPISATAA